MGIVLIIILVVIVVVLVVYAISTYNGLVRRRNETEEAYRQIDVQLKRGYDLSPNLLEGVKKYFRQEQDVLTQITQARSRAMQPQSPSEQAQSEARLSGAIGNLFAVAENYPELRSDRVGAIFGLVLAFVVGTISGLATYYGGARMVLAASRAKEVTHDDAPVLFNVVEEMTIAAGLPMPKVYIIDDSAPNAFATGRDPEHASVAVTS